MSHEAFAWALRQRVPASERFVLALLAERANHEGVSFPGHANVAELTGLSPRTVKRAIARLEALGLLERHARFADNGRQRSNVYVLRLDRGVSFGEIMQRESRWRAARGGAATLLEAAPELPPAPSDPVDNPGDKEPELSTGVTRCPGEGDTVSPPEGDTVSPLEPPCNPDPVDTPVVNYSAAAVDNERRAPARADASSPPAPAGAAGSASEQGAGVPHAELARRFDLVDDAFRRRGGAFEAEWLRTLRRRDRRDAWLDVLRNLDDARIQHAIVAATRYVNQVPPSASKFLMLTFSCSTSDADAPARDRRVGRKHLREWRERRALAAALTPGGSADAET